MTAWPAITRSTPRGLLTVVVSLIVFSSWEERRSCAAPV
jgi:hypothetical protein